MSMRPDHEYVDKATALVLTTTRAGDEYLENVDVDVDNVEDGSLEDLLVAVASEYFEVPSGGLNEWYEAFVGEYEKSFGTCSVTYETFVEAFVKGLLGVKKVVWG